MSAWVVQKLLACGNSVDLRLFCLKYLCIQRRTDMDPILAS